MASEAEINSIMATIRKRESGNNYTVKNRHSTASGAYQYIDSTWRSWLGRLDPSLVARYPTAKDAPPELQDRVARLNVQSILDSAGGRIDAVPRAWYTGDPNAPDGMQPGGAGNEGHTVGRYVQGWMGDYGRISGDPTAATRSAAIDGSGATEVSTSSASSAPTDTRTPEQYAMEEFGQFSAFLQHPELGPILTRAATEKWSDAILEAEIHKTQWWQATNETMRRWDALQGSDPNQATSQINGEAAQIMARANQLGMPISPERARVIAQNSLRFGWQGAELDNAIGADSGQQQLLTSTFGRGLTTTARQYGIPLSEQTIGSWAARIASGQDTIENFNSEMVRKATNMYPEAQAHLEKGGTIDEFYDPYREIAAKTLGINPSEIDFMDPKWGSALSMADEEGKRRAMSMDQWQQQLKQVPAYGYAKTKAATDEAATLADNLKRSWGL